ncbi:MAG: protein phosphatase 2C domain-containing protein [Sciscionella sp.]|nr:protein phosphatase 2C domain-containing protein [Sciscionella sp.]
MERMSIGEFARVSGLSPKALRLYDAMGLLRPAAVDEFTGYRYYGGHQLDGARLVARLRLIGMPLDRIRVFVELPVEARQAELLSYWRQVEADHVSKREEVTVLADELRGTENRMLFDQTLTPTVATGIGIGQRDRQLDALTTGSRLFAVADGFGSDTELSARVVAAVRTADDVHGAVDPVELLDSAVGAAVRAAVSAAVSAAGREADAVARRDDSGCTLSMLVLGDTQAAIAHVGDSRVYVIRDGRLQRLTRDHSLVQSLVDEGRLTPEEARAHEQRPLLNRAIASKAVAPDVSIVAMKPADRFVLCTDGVHAVLPATTLADLLTESRPAVEVVESVRAAVLAAGAPDNYALIVVDPSDVDTGSGEGGAV